MYFFRGQSIRIFTIYLLQEHKFNYDPNEQLYWSVMIGPSVDQVTILPISCPISFLSVLSYKQLADTEFLT
jgi:hypothetical protein